MEIGEIGVNLAAKGIVLSVDKPLINSQYARLGYIADSMPDIGQIKVCPIKLNDVTSSSPYPRTFNSIMYKPGLAGWQLQEVGTPFDNSHIELIPPENYGEAVFRKIYGMDVPEYIICLGGNRLVQFHYGITHMVGGDGYHTLRAVDIINRGGIWSRTRYKPHEANGVPDGLLKPIKTGLYLYEDNGLNITTARRTLVQPEVVIGHISSTIKTRRNEGTSSSLLTSTGIQIRMGRQLNHRDINNLFIKDISRQDDSIEFTIDTTPAYRQLYFCLPNLIQLPENPYDMCFDNLINFINDYENLGLQFALKEYNIII